MTVAKENNEVIYQICRCTWTAYINRSDRGFIGGHTFELIAKMISKKYKSLKGKEFSNAN